MPGYPVTKEKIDFRDLRVSGYEWGVEQKDAQGERKIRQEKWNSAPKE